MAIAAAPTTYDYIESKIRNLCSAPKEQNLTSRYIQQRVNIFYNSDFPYAIKLDEMRSVYTFYTRPYVDTYPLDVNYNQGVRAPFYVDGIQGGYYKDREQFFNLFPKWPTQFQQGVGISGSISNITGSAPVTITSSTSGLSVGDYVTISGVVGLTGINGGSYEVLSVSGLDFTVNATVTGTYISGGSWVSTTNFNFFVNPTPFLRGEVTIGGVYENGSAFTIADVPLNISGVADSTDTTSPLQFQTPNPIVSVPSQSSSAPGMKNLNTDYPGQNIVSSANGSVNYVTGQMSFRLPQPLKAGTNITIWVSQYSTGRPYTLLFWNNMFTIRPVPKLVHKCTIETYLTPVQFLQSSDGCILNQWINYLAFGTSVEIMRERNDFDAVEKLKEGMARQEGLVLERQAVGEIGARNSTIFTNTVGQWGWNQGANGGWW